MAIHTVHVIDSHTEGEPTRVVISGGPDLGPGSVADRLRVFREHHDAFRSAVCNEPRGSDALVGALLVEPVNPKAVAGVIFFNNVGFLNMCVHGTIGLAATLVHLGRIGAGDHLVETPVGDVTISVGKEGAMVSVANVPSYRFKKDVPVRLADGATVTGDIAWGGNWFFLIEAHPWSIDLGNAETLTDVTWRIRQAVNAQGYPEVDHVELFGPPRSGGHSRNFVLCPGKAYDRSPCGTGTSAKLACLAADGKLAEGDPWVQESILGSTFTGRFRWLNRDTGTVVPTITGTAHVNAEATLVLSKDDPFCWGIRPA